MRVQSIGSNNNYQQKQQNFRGGMIKFSPTLAVDADLIGLVKSSEKIAGKIRTHVFPIRENIPGFTRNIITDAPVGLVSKSVHEGKIHPTKEIDLSNFEAYIGC